MANILIVDDDKNIQYSFNELFKDRHSILTAYNGKDAVNIVNNKQVDLVYLDVRLPGENGISVLQKIKKIDNDIYVIIITAHGNAEVIVNAMSFGAFDYVEKPIDIDKIESLTEKALKSRKINSHIKLLYEENIKNYSLSRIIGKSQCMQEIFKKIGQLVNNDVAVLITGESGTGKELIAKAIHYNSNRKDEPFVAVNCSGLQDTLLDNELFGHESQAFTGAHSSKKGKFEVTGEGTIFLDEIGDMPQPLQSKLLRVLQEREFNRLGGNKIIHINARIIAATNKDIPELINAGKFREDLYYRIKVATIEIPPLSARKEDIPLLVEYFISGMKRKLKKNIAGISQNALNRLIDYDWPGNVRELENILINICLNTNANIINSINIPKFYDCSKNENIFDKFIDDYLSEYGNTKDLFPFLVQNLETRLIKAVGEKLNYNKTAMSRILGISRVTLQKKI